MSEFASELLTKVTRTKGICMNFSHLKPADAL